MNANRRKFFGLMGGAAVAGPAVAKQAIAQLPQGLGMAIDAHSRLGGPQEANGICGHDKDWRLSRIAQLRRFISGDLTDEEKEELRRRKMHSRQSIISQEVASLVSVSGVRKLDIYNERLHRLHLEIELSENRSSLARFLKDMGE
ncbi:hypothetical protein [Ensifer aridi]|uniref:hypothetical protein n=1 Tax=Ensifer aridi TaxID=1708715 RepID=UPI000A11492F|nr:hypothetical protein [Ensifer aridi]